MKRAHKNGTERRATTPVNPAPPERQVKTKVGIYCACGHSDLPHAGPTGAGACLVCGDAVCAEFTPAIREVVSHAA